MSSKQNHYLCQPRDCKLGHYVNLIETLAVTGSCGKLDRLIGLQFLYMSVIDDPLIFH